MFSKIRDLLFGVKYKSVVLAASHGEPEKKVTGLTDKEREAEIERLRQEEVVDLASKPVEINNEPYDEHYLCYEVPARWTTAVDRFVTYDKAEAQDWRNSKGGASRSYQVHTYNKFDTSSCKTKCLTKLLMEDSKYGLFVQLSEKPELIHKEE